MNTTNITVNTGEYGSRVLADWIASREGAAERAGLANLGENEITSSGTTFSELASLLGANTRSSSGEQVTRDTALRVSAVYGCVSLIAGAIATLPVGIYQRTENGPSKADHPYWFLFNEQASENWTSAAAWEYVISAKLFYGDGFARWIRPSPVSNRVIGWEPLHPLSVQPFKKDGRVLYRINPHGEPSQVLDSADILHLPSLGFDGLISPSPITYAAREAIGTALAGQRYTGRFFSDGAQFDYALKTDSKLKTDQLNALRASLLARLQNGGRGPLILDGGLTPAQLSVNSKDAEILATRLFTVEEICRILGVPPHLVGHTDKTTSWGSGVENMGIGFVRYTLQRHLTPIAQELNRKLWPVREKHYVEHITAALERGDLKSRYEAYRIALGRAGEMPFMDHNEIRRLENLPANENLQRNGGSNAQPTAPAAGAEPPAV
ncbi:phage portal protein [Chromobacterium haemolyticum]|uniref:phage portal protein n=1 Tax=Chromobacterium haemolyticum TaxID=394935 RepID=UPI000585A9A2|nr:phage portal protein [Chromobacterium haemolyticum]